MKYILILLFLCFGELVQAKTITYGEEPVELKVIFGQTHFLIFDKPVASASNNPNFRLSPAESSKFNFKKFTLKPRFKKGEGQISFVFDDNSSAEIKFETVEQPEEQVTYGTYQLKPEIKQSEEGNNQQDRSGLTEFDLLKAMYLGRSARGYQYKHINRTLKTTDWRVKAKVVRSYVGPTLKGFIIELQNTSLNNSFAVDIRKIVVGSPNQAIIGTVDRLVLENNPKKNGYIWLIVNGTAKASQIGKIHLSKRRGVQ